MQKYDRDAPVDWVAMEQKLADKLGLIITNKETFKKNNTMAKESKILSANYTRTWDGPNGAVHYYDLKLENGDAGAIGTKTKDNPSLAPGQVINYSIEQKGEYKGVPQFTIKLEQAPRSYSGGGGAPRANSKETDERIARSVAIREAVALHTGLGLSALPYDVINTAMYFEHYVATGVNLLEDAATDAKNKDRDSSPF